MSINQGRVNNAAKALDDWHAATFDQLPSRVDRLVYTKMVQIVLEVDDRYIVKQTQVADSRLRVALAKAHEKIDDLGQQVNKLNQRIHDAGERDRQATERLEAAKLLERQADGWRRADAARLAQVQIALEQLRAAGIEPDRRLT